MEIVPLLSNVITKPKFIVGSRPSNGLNTAFDLSMTAVLTHYIGRHATIRKPSLATGIGKKLAGFGVEDAGKT
jgi:hypothetical protein